MLNLNVVKESVCEKVRGEEGEKQERMVSQNEEKVEIAQYCQLSLYK